MILLDSQLTFVETGHRYFLAGQPLPSVTQVLTSAKLLDYDFLGDRREVYLARGKAVHAATHRDDDHDLDEDSVPPEIRGYLLAWRKFRRDYGFVPQWIEYRVYNEQYQYAGTLDRVGNVRDGSEFIVDLKTGVAPPAVRYQLAAYSACLPHPRMRQRRCVELHHDGTYRVLRFKTSDYLHDFAVFAAALEEFKNKEER
jgi:hypothetical protein